MSSTLLQRNNFSSSKTSWRRLANTFWRRLQDVLWDVFKTSSRRIWKMPPSRGFEDVLEDEKLLRWRSLEDVLEINKMFTGISVLNHSLLRNFNQYLTNLYLTNLYLTNLRRIKKFINYNPITSIFVLFWNSISRINSKSTLQNRWGNKNEVLSNISHKYNEWLFILTFTFNLHLKKLILLRFIYELDKWDKRDLEKSLQSEPPKRKHQNKARKRVTEDHIWIYPFHY